MKKRQCLMQRRCLRSNEKGSVMKYGVGEAPDESVAKKVGGKCDEKGGVKGDVMGDQKGE